MEGDPVPEIQKESEVKHFNPLPPHGGRRPSHLLRSLHDVFQSTPSAWRETTGSDTSDIGKNISIHSLRMEGDNIIESCGIVSSNFNPLPPHGGRLVFLYILIHRSKFQSTPSAWRETGVSIPGTVTSFISIHSLRMEGDDLNGRPLPPQSTISIHSLRMEGDGNNHLQSILPVHFNPLPPHGGRPRRPADTLQERVISIHSLRMEGDQPKPPAAATGTEFQSTPSAWRETLNSSSPDWQPGISIHSLRMEGDRGDQHVYFEFSKFQSTPSAWRET